MIYFESDKEYVFLWPSIAISTVGEFWIALAWLCFEIGWRSGDDGEQNWEGKEA